MHEPPNTLELRLLEAACADLRFKLQGAEERAATERQAAAAAQQAAEGARREAAQQSEALAGALGRCGRLAGRADTWGRGTREPCGTFAHLLECCTAGQPAENSPALAALQGGGAAGAAGCGGR